MSDWTNFEPQERFWLTVEGEQILSELGMENPTRDPVDERILDLLEEILELADNDYMKQIIAYLLERLEEEI